MPSGIYQNRCFVVAPRHGVYSGETAVRCHGSEMTWEVHKWFVDCDGFLRFSPPYHASSLSRISVRLLSLLCVLLPPPYKSFIVSIIKSYDYSLGFHECDSGRYRHPLLDDI